MFKFLCKLGFHKYSKRSYIDPYLTCLRCGCKIQDPHIVKAVNKFFPGAGERLLSRMEEVQAVSNNSWVKIKNKEYVDQNTFTTLDNLPATWGDGKESIEI